MSDHWIAVDWGTSNLRIWRMDGAQAVDEVRSDQGMGSLAPDEFEPCLLSHIEPWLNEKTLVLACGMVGAKQGWVQADYIPAPCAVIPQLVQAPANDPRLNVRIAAGVCQRDPADVMRGEETQIAGFLAQNPDFEGVVALPGTHCKWVRIAGGQIERFSTMMTGESFALYARQSVLRFSMGGWDHEEFLRAVSEGYHTPETVPLSLFNIRARDLLKDDKTGEARLSGLLIGAELAATKALWNSQPIAIIGAGTLSQKYDGALREIGAEPQVFEGHDMTLQGLKLIKETIS